MSRYELFDRSRIQLRPLAERGHDLLAERCLPLKEIDRPFEHPELAQLVERITAARRDNRPVIVFMGAHPIKLGLSRFLVDLIGRKMITHLATNGAGMIHDFELASFGGTSESVARWIIEGQFGLWEETSRINDLARLAADNDAGLGETIGKTLCEDKPPHCELSLAAAAWRAGVPVTSHVGIGNDILHAMPNCDGAAWGRASYNDFLIFAQAINQLEGGVFLNIGTAVTGPEVFLKALSMSRNVAKSENREIRDFTTAVFDLATLPDDWRDGEPSKEHPQYYYRPWKTLLLRTIADGGRSHYFRGDHRRTIPTLWAELTR